MLTTSVTFLTLSQAKSFMCTKPWMPPISTKAPNLTTFLTTPFLFSPGFIPSHIAFWFFSWTSSSITLLEATTLFLLKSNSIILTSNSFPIRDFKSILSLLASEAGINTLIDP